MVLITYALCSLRFLKLKAEGKITQKQKTSPKKLQTEIKTLVNPGLA